MSGPNFTWDNTNDVLQGISSTPSQAELSPNGLPSSDLTLGDPASFLGHQFGTDSGVLPHNNASFLNQWSPHKQSTSPTPQQMDYFHYPSARFMSNQDSWSPLQVTGIPTNVAFASRPMGKAHLISGFDRRCSTGQYSTPSENGSQYNGLHSEDSGYSTRSWTTRSIAASYAVDSACSPYLGPHEYERDEKVPPLDISSTHHSEAMDIAEEPESPSLLCHDTIKCEYPKCPWTGKCPSDKRKHEARHKKLFKCDEPNCTRKEGFGTINDLARHKKCVHKKEPERGPKVLYMCFGHNCPRSNKKWPRLDNFRQHLARMHNNEDLDELLRRSHEWYETCVKPHDIASAFGDNISEAATPCQSQHFPEPEILTHDPDQELRDSIAPIHTAFQSSNMLTLDSIKRLDEEHEMHEVDHIPTQTVELSALKVLDLEPALEQKVCNPSQLINNKNDKMDDMVGEAAVSVINAMTKMINNHQRRRSHLGEDDIAEPEGELSDRNREILQKILITASGLLSGNSGPINSISQESAVAGSDKTGWIQCEFCPKRTRLRCEMKKHKKRHERPYGCTFYKCDKTFGSKADWKRHEQSQHFGIQSWQCTVPETTQEGTLCARMFNSQESYTQHLKKHHQVTNDEIETSICKNRLGWNGEPQFWCGFCRDIIHLRGDGHAAWNQRFNHIDIEHFKKGERIDDWLLPSGHVTKGRERKDAQAMELEHDDDDDDDDDDDGESEPIIDNSDAESACSSHSEHELTHEDVMAVEQDLPDELFTQSTSQSEQTNHRKRKLRTVYSMLSLSQGIEPGSATVEKKSRIQTPASGQNHPPQNRWKVYLADGNSETAQL
ncbi:hypothetical protein BDW59DRAFT_162405 [Aspergillus cavernicola]|uniref:C2H2-type domain-containing protein n=1 Tax=Aspergillus cavernicola TaxID=176166 RepID=A0ABR4ICB6_9EURO